MVAGQSTDADAFVMDARQLERLPCFDIAAFVKAFAEDKHFKSSLLSSIEFLQNSINLDEVRAELELSDQVDFDSAD